MASIFHKGLKERARFFAKAKEAFLRLYFCVKFEDPTIFLGIPFSQKCHRKTSLVLRRTEIRSLLLFCEKMRGSKNFRICGSSFQFLWILQMTNACLIQTRLPKCFFQRNVKTPFRGQTLIQTSK